MDSSKFGLPQRWPLYAGVLAIVVFAALASWWLLSPGQQVLFGKLREADAAEIVAALDEWKVPYRITDGGAAITVPADRVHETRMKLVSAGIPTGGHVGFELFDDADFGVTEFAQRVNFQRALQGEIERTIASLPGVEGARVHLTIQRPGLFVAEKEVSKASVSLVLAQGATISPAQVAGIQGLVASAVEGLTPEGVVVLGRHGELLGGGAAGQPGASADDRQGEQAKQEERLRGRLVALLSRILADGRFTVSVDVQLNFDTVREVNQRLLPQGDDGNGLVTRRRVQSAGTGPGEEPRPGASSQEELEYAHSSSRQEISRATGRVERVSVAVVLPPDLDEFEVERIRSLVAAASGIDTDRGDRLEVSRVRGDGALATAASAVQLATAAPPPVDIDADTAHAPLDLRAWAARFGVIAAFVVLAAVLIAAASGRRGGRRLGPGEREAALARLRAWLAEGDARA